MQGLKVNDRVKVEFEGRITSHGIETVRVTPEKGPGQYVHPDYVTLIEPKYEHDGIYQAADGVVYRFTNNNGNEPWQKISGGAGYRYYVHEHPLRPLVRLVPEK